MLRQRIIGNFLNNYRQLWEQILYWPLDYFRIWAYNYRFWEQMWLWKYLSWLENMDRTFKHLESGNTAISQYKPVFSEKLFQLGFHIWVPVKPNFNYCACKLCLKKATTFALLDVQKYLPSSQRFNFAISKSLKKPNDTKTNRHLSVAPTTKFVANVW